MRVRISLVLLLFLCCTLISGCTDQKNEAPVESPSPVDTIIQTPEPTVQETEPGVPAAATTTPSVFDQPVSQPPANLTVSVTVRKDPVYATIITTFNGGKGQDLLRSIRVRTTLSTGEVMEEDLGTEKGDELIQNGTRGQDRVQVLAGYLNGNSYLITDTILAPSRQENGTAPVQQEKTMSISEEGLYPGPVILPPNNLDIMVDVQKEPIYRVITATFRGGHGQFLVSRIDMNAVLGNGEPATRQIESNIGAIAEIQGTDGVDRVQVVVRYKNGETYKIYEKAFGPRGESFS